jgi:hypothetical protein
LVTVIGAEQFTVPPGPVAVSRYVVLVEGCTSLLPAATGVTEPMLLLMDALVALVVVQESVAVSPGAMEDFDIARVQVGAGFVVVTVIGTEQWATSPVALVAVPV